MTASTSDVVALDAKAGQERHETWGDVAARLAWQISHKDFPRGDLAGLRRMKPDAPDAAVFWRLMADQDLLEKGAEVERKWALILNGIALMTRTAGSDASSRSAHDGSIPVGEALFRGGDPSRSDAFYSETRLKRLLSSRGSMTRRLLERTFRMLASANVSFSWREMANFILSDGFNDAAAESHRRGIASYYFQAQRRSQPVRKEQK